MKKCMCSVFSTPMGGDDQFLFKILQSSGGDSCNLMVPEMSLSYRWTATTVAGRNAKTPIYTLAEDPLLVCDWYCMRIILTFNNLIDSCCTKHFIP